MLTLTQKKEKIFYFLRDVYDKCQESEPFSLKKKRQEHSLDIPNFRHALDKSGLIETTGKKNGEHGSYYYSWVASVQPNLKTAEKLFEEMNKKTDNKTPDKKTCVTCGETKNANEFYKHPTNKDRLTSSCKECMKAKQKKKQPTPKQQTKWCSACKEDKPVSEFYNNRSTKDGLSKECKSCIKERDKRRTQQKQINQKVEDSHQFNHEQEKPYLNPLQNTETINNKEQPDTYSFTIKIGKKTIQITILSLTFIVGGVIGFLISKVI